MNEAGKRTQEQIPTRWTWQLPETTSQINEEKTDEPTNGIARMCYRLKEN